MATTLYEHMVAVGQRLAQDSSRKVTRGRLIRAVKADGLTQTELVEIEKDGLQRTAKRVLRALKSQPNLFQHAGIDAPTMGEMDTSLEQLDWQIDQYRRAIKSFTKLLAKCVKQREEILAKQLER